VVEHVCDRVAVMYLGRIVELANTADLYGRQSHPYTEALISAAPEPDRDRRRQRIVLSGDPPSPEAPPPGCPFHPRCPKVMEHCHSEVPAERDIGHDGRRHLVRCHLY
jgi:oligopeptide/dipeptide ABC transporter ATP-binding protein